MFSSRKPAAALLVSEVITRATVCPGRFRPTACWPATVCCTSPLWPRSSSRLLEVRVYVGPALDCGQAYLRGLRVARAGKGMHHALQVNRCLRPLALADQALGKREVKRAGALRRGV